MAQIVAIGVGDGDERFDRVDILRLDLRDGRIGREEGEASQGLNESVPFQRHVEDARDANGTADAVQAEGRHFQIVAVLQSHAERS